MEIVEVMFWPSTGSLIRCDIAFGKRLAGLRVSSVKAIPCRAMNHYITSFKSNETRAKGNGVFVIIPPVEVHRDRAGEYLHNNAFLSLVDNDGGISAVWRCVQPECRCTEMRVVIGLGNVRKGHFAQFCAHPRIAIGPVQGAIRCQKE